MIAVRERQERRTEISLSHWFIVAKTESGSARLGRETGEAAMRVLVRARMMLDEIFMVNGKQSKRLKLTLKYDSSL